MAEVVVEKLPNRLKLGKFEDVAKLDKVNEILPKTEGILILMFTKDNTAIFFSHGNHPGAFEFMEVINNYLVGTYGVRMISVALKPITKVERRG